MEQEKQNQRKFALLIDCDNISVDKLGGILEEITSKYGTVTIRRAYADWTATNIKNAWTTAKMGSFAVSPVQQFRQKGKNSSDIALVVDAMDILHSEAVDGFCIWSSDSDYIRLIMRMRESAKYVIGFGERKSNENLINVCDRFIFTENLGDLGVVSSVVKSKPKKLAAKQINQLKSIVDRSVMPDESELSLSHLGTRMYRIAPDFDPRNYDCSSLSQLMKDFTADGEVAWELTMNEGQHYLKRRTSKRNK